MPQRLDGSSKRKASAILQKRYGKTLDECMPFRSYFLRWPGELELHVVGMPDS